MKKMIILLLLISDIILLSCSEKREIKIGFSGSLSGKFSDFGTDGRDGVIIAIDEINSNGGINGRKLVLLTSDDKGIPEEALKGDLDLISKGVAVIIGHMTSSMTMAVINTINEKRVVMIAPTTSTDLLSNKDDYFFRVVSTTKVESINLADAAFNRLKIRRIAYIYDLSNRAFTENWVNNFKTSFNLKGGRNLNTVQFSSLNNERFSDIVSKAMTQTPDGIAVVANSQDSALMCQQIRKISKKMPILLCSWAQTKDIIINGGESVEGVIFSHHYNKDYMDNRYTDFRRKYIERFKRDPEFPSVFSYNAMMVIYDALMRDSRPENLKNTIVQKSLYHGLQGDLIINQYGDAETRFHLITIKNGEFTGLYNEKNKTE